MSHTQHSIAQWAQKNEELLGILQRTDYAQGAEAQQKLYIKDLEKELAPLNKSITILEYKTKIEQAEFERYRDSNMKRFAYKLGGSKGKEKFTSRTEKEEREYQEALEAERSAKDRQGSINSALSEARRLYETYKQDSAVHTRAQNELDNLYNMVFAGPTPDFPAEDQLEWNFNQCRERFNAIEQRHRSLSQACEILGEAGKAITRARTHMNDARQASRYDMLGGGRTADMAERSALSRAEGEANQVRMLVMQAQRIFPEGIRDIGPMEVPAGNILGDVLFDNIFSDMAFHDKIKASQLQFEKADGNIRKQWEALKQQEAEQKVILDQHGAELYNARRNLQDTRSQIFSQVGSQVGVQAPPIYQQ